MGKRLRRKLQQSLPGRVSCVGSFRQLASCEKTDWLLASELQRTSPTQLSRLHDPSRFRPASVLLQSLALLQQNTAGRTKETKQTLTNPYSHNPWYRKRGHFNAHVGSSKTDRQKNAVRCSTSENTLIHYRAMSLFGDYQSLWCDSF